MADNAITSTGIKRLVTILANVGIETGIDPKIAPGFSQLSNVQINRQGAFSQRPKFTALPIQPALGYTGILATMSGAPTLITDVGVYMYAGTTGRDGGFVNVNEGVSNGKAFVFVSCENINLGLDEIKEARNGCMVIFDNYILLTYLARSAGVSSNLYLNVYSKYSYELITSLVLANYTFDKAIHTPNAPIVLMDNDEVAMVFYGEADGDVVVREITIAASEIVVGSAVSVGSSNQIVHSAAAELASLDACRMSDTYAGVVFVGQIDTAHNPCLRIFNRTSAGTYASVADTNFALTGDCGGISCFSMADTRICMVMYDTGATPKEISVKTYNYLGTVEKALETAITDTNGFISAGGFEIDTAGDTSVIVAQKTKTASKMSELWRRTYNYTAGVSGTAAIFVCGLNVLAKPFPYNTRAFLPVSFTDEWSLTTNPGIQSDQQWVGIVGNKDMTALADRLKLGSKPFAIAGVDDASLSPLYPFFWWTPQFVFQSGNDVYFIYFKKFAAANTEQSAVICHAKFLAKPSLIDVHGSLLASASIPMAYDGRNLDELGFLQYPFITLTEGAVTSDIAKGSYAYSAVYEWIDGDGYLHRSAPNAAVTIATSAINKSVTVTFSTLQCTWKTGVKVVIYRSKVDLPLVLYRLASVDNDDTLGLGTYIDTRSDATAGLATSAELYMSTTNAPNIMPPQHTVACMYQNRHFCADADHPGRVRYSKPIGHESLTDGIEHGGAMYFDVPGEADITGMSALDDKLIIFTADKIYATYGEGLSAGEAGSNYVQPFLVSGHSGCANHRTVVAIDQGLMFDSGTSIMMLERSLQLTDIGIKVQYYYNAMTVTQALVDKKRDQVLFFGTPTNAITLVFNYRYGIWSTHNYGAKSACYSNDLVYIEDAVSDNAYSVKVEDTVYSNITMDIVSNWVNLGELGGAHRVHNVLIMGQHVSTAVTVRVSLAFNYEPYWRQTKDFDLSSITPFDSDAHYGAGSSTYQDDAMVLKLQPAVQKCTAFRVRITQYGTPGATPSFDVTSIMAEVSDDEGFAPVGTVRRGGS